jgi:hypothetical protein
MPVNAALPPGLDVVGATVSVQGLLARTRILSTIRQRLMTRSDHLLGSDSRAAQQAYPNACLNASNAVRRGEVVSSNVNRPVPDTSIGAEN